MESVDVWTNADNGIIDPEPTRGWTLYYDETNNHRKFIIDPSKEWFVNSEDAVFNDFILGGIAVPPGIELDIDRLRRQLGLNGAVEMKAKNLFGTGDYTHDIGSKRVQTFLKWMIDSPLEIHFSTSDNLFDAVIEVVDKSLMCEGGRAVMIHHWVMKDVLYRYVSKDVKGFIRILHRHGYPEMSMNDECRFCEDMAAYIDDICDSADGADALFLETIKQNLLAASCFDRRQSLNYGKRNEIISSYHQNYWYVMLNTPLAMHIFDHESIVEYEMRDVQLMDNGVSYNQYAFMDSKECEYIQIADMFIGLLGKTFRWIDNTSENIIFDTVKQMSMYQKKSFFLLNELINRSDTFCPFLIQNMVADSKLRKRFDTIQYIADSYTYKLLL